MRRIARTLLGCSALLTLHIIGCDDEPSPIAPPTGTIMIDAEPDSIAAPWTLVGPGGYVRQGNGDLTLTGLLLGEYTLNWGEVEARLLPTPSEQTQMLEDGSDLLFAGTYAIPEPTPPEGFVYIAPGSFTMGSPLSEPDRDSDETQHTVILTHGFHIAKYEVTQQQWAEVMGGSPTTSQLPQGSISWDMVVQFCNALSERENLTPAYTILGANGNATWNREANGYRLPTEAEWEYACRAQSSSAFHNGTDCLSSDTEANFNGTYPFTDCPTGTRRTGPSNVGSFPANAWGLHDMHGNLWELVWDGYREDYENLPATDPVHDVGPGASRVFRSGAWNHGAGQCRSASRGLNAPNYSFSGFGGLRLARSAS